MASGKQHFIADLIILGVSLPYIPYYTNEIVLGNLIGTLFTPDIDDEGGTYNEILLANTVRFILVALGRGKQNAVRDTKIIYRLQKMITAPYGVMIPHRSWLSHAPIISTITITFYIWLLYFVGGKLLDYQVLNYLDIAKEYYVAFILITVHHIVHTAMDGFMIIFWGKKVYLLGYPFYHLTTKLFPQGE